MQQQILETYPAADLAIYAIWLPILPTDARDQWDGQLLDDPRVTHLWDPERTVGRWLADIDLGNDDEVLWDAFLLFGPEATWESAPSEPLAWGAPIVGRFPELANALAPLLGESAGTDASTPVAVQSALIDERRPLVFATRREAFRANDARYVVN